MSSWRASRRGRRRSEACRRLAAVPFLGMPVRPLASLLFFLIAPCALTAQGTMPYRDRRLPAAVRARDLLARMTAEEKFWQLYMVPGDLADSSEDHSHGVFGLQVPAAVSPSADASRINAIQRYFIDSTRLGIPIIPFEEAVHGVVRPGATVFPAAIGLAATWDTALMAEVATAAAIETRS